MHGIRGKHGGGAPGLSQEPSGYLLSGPPTAPSNTVITHGSHCEVLCNPLLTTEDGEKGRAQHFLRNSNSGVDWMADARISSVLDGQWLDRNTGRIRPELVMALDCFSQEIVNGQIVLSNRANLGLIEQVLVGVQNSVLIQGLIPLRF